MSIFRRDSDLAEPEPSAAPPRPTPRSAPADRTTRDSTHIAAGSKVVGEISGATELVVDGEVEGQIVLESRVVIGSEGRVKGEIQARSVQVGGNVRGNVRGLERVEVLASGRLEGDVISPRVVIAEGAFFKGKVEMTDKAGGARPRPVSQPETKGTATESAAEGKATGGREGERGGADQGSTEKTDIKPGGRIGK